MSFSQTNSIRNKKNAVKENLNELPKTISLVQTQIEEIFSLFDSIGKNLVNLAVFNIDADILESFDNDFRKYNQKKGEVSSILSDFVRLSTSLQDTENLFGSNSGSAINESVIGDLQNILGNINETIGSDINSKLEELQVLKQELETINNEVKQPVEQINESLQLFQKTSDVSFEIFTKSMLESLKNSVEMKSITENLEEKIYELDELGRNIPAKVQDSLKDEIRSVVNESMVNLDTKIQKVLEEKLKDIKLTFTTELSNLMDSKFNEMMGKIQSAQVQPSNKTPEAETSQSRDMREVSMFLKYLYTMPTDKDDIIKKIEDFRDILLVRRSDDPPFRVTATNTFRESISEISREDRHIPENKIRDVIQLFENLKRVIE